ncbi:PREDICTED: macrophage mannose receptor 1-like [Thamnophis sirtalis]|uniref:Macrophage mannose receptor 1-like n=1 Tax=Thamnophis sirtalis TaxID=35019 RepID=A0A6I9XWV2_9SAUR|nr:PREDICTED: macrophage mannose receptor 1-like [Thamnophis sirtalis]
MQGRHGKWANNRCELKHGYICKRTNSSIQASSPSSEDLKPIKCPNNWVGYAKHCYRLNRDRKTWKDASVSCQKDGGHLLSIHDIEEYSFVFSQLGYESTDNLWVGLNDQKTFSYFEWSDGTTVRFIKWQKGEPTLISNVQEDCVIMTGKNGYMADYFCEEELGYICKKEPSEFLSGTDEVADPKCQKGWKRYGFYCYLIGGTSGTFSEAKTSCESKQGFLISVENRFEQAFLTTQIGHRPEKYFWIGLSDVVNPGTFNWTNGDPIRFTHWNAKMPGPNPGCVAMRTGDAAGLWDVVNCEETATFLCKQLAEGVTPPPIPEPTPPPPCPEGWTASLTRNVCFKAYIKKKAERKSWYEAYDFCKSIGGDLGYFNSKTEERLLNQLSEPEGWNDLSANLNGANLTWIDGTLVYTYVPFHWISENEYDERCKIIWGETGSWSPFPCHGLLNWICQITRGTPLNPETSDNFENSFTRIEDGWIEYGNNEYYFSNTTMPAEKARKFCKQHGGDLTIIESKEEKIFLWKYVRNIGLWHDINCGHEKSFICERHNNSIRTTAAPTLPSTPKGCSEGWLWFNEKCFQIFGFKEEEMKNWTDARDHCKNLGGNLASIPNKAVQGEEARKKCESENAKLATIVDPYAESFIWLQVLQHKEPVWIGLSSKESDARYKWISNWKVVYTNWADEEPLHKVACVYLDTEGYWKTGNCSEKYLSVCERYYGVVPTEIPQLPGKCQTSKNSRISWIPFRGHCYKVYVLKRSWPAAVLMCTQIGGALTSVEDSDELQFLQEQMGKLEYTDFWIGLFKNMDGEWLWQDNNEVAFVNWNESELKFLQSDSEEDKADLNKCIYMNSDSGKWFVGHCHYYEMRSFICKRNKIIEESTLKSTAISGQKGVAPLPTHGTTVMIVIPIIFIVIGAGIAAYIFYRRRNRAQQVSAGFDHSLYSDNVVTLHKDSQPLVDSEELN